jgi:hypothetical protein
MDTEYIALNGLNFEKIGEILVSEDGTLTVLDADPKHAAMMFSDADISKYSDFIKKNIIVSLGIKTLASDLLVDIRGLGDYSSIEKLSVDLAVGTEFRYALQRAKDFEGVKDLSIRGALPTNFIKFENLKSVRRLVCDYKKNLPDEIKKLENLKDLFIHNYDEPDLLRLQSISSIERLTLVLGKMQSLVGVELLPNLKTLRIVNGKKLTHISSINDSETLRNIMFEDYKKIKNWNFLASNSKLKCISIDTAENVDFIKKMNFLEYFFCKNAINYGGKHVLFKSAEGGGVTENTISIVDWIPACDVFYDVI